MGSLITAKCECGFDKRMALGGGMRNHLTYCAFPCYCKDCKSLYLADLFSNNASCTKCESKNTLPYDDNRMRIKVKAINVRPITRYVQQSFWEKLILRKPKKIVKCVNSDSNVFDWNTEYKIGRDISLTDEQYLCPSCQNFKLKFYADGLWD